MIADCSTENHAVASRSTCRIIFRMLELKLSDRCEALTPLGALMRLETCDPDHFTVNHCGTGFNFVEKDESLTVNRQTGEKRESGLHSYG